MKSLLNYIASSKVVDIVKKNCVFFACYLVFCGYGLYNLIFEKLESTLLFLNRNNSKFLDVFFYYVTNIGDGIVYIIALIPLAIIRIRFAIYGFVSYVISGLLAQVLKRIFNTPRPKLLLEDIDLHFVEGVDVFSHHSFPSGHAVSAFSLLLLIAMITPKKYLGVLFFLVAFFSGISRVYLAQHFFIDVFLGSLIGVIVTIVVVIKVDEYYLKNNIEWMNLSILEVFKKKKGKANQ